MRTVTTPTIVTHVETPTQQMLTELSMDCSQTIWICLLDYVHLSPKLLHKAQVYVLKTGQKMYG
jgi:hypothetical protein